jgi:hypothetical protein
VAVPEICFNKSGTTMIKYNDYKIIFVRDNFSKYIEIIHRFEIRVLN